MAKIIITIILFSGLFSQYESILILDIAVEGNQRLSQQDILRNARLFKGMSIQGSEIQQAIKRLWKLRRFGNIQILVDDETDEGLYLRIIVEEFPVLGEIEFEGNKKISKRALEDELDLTTGQILSEHAVFEAMEKIRSMYAKKHYHNVIIDTVYSSGKNTSSKNLKFVISIGKKTRIKKISFSGNNVYSDRKMLKQFTDNKAKKWFLPWGGAWKEDLFDSDKGLLVQFYKNRGYRDFYIVNESVQLTENGTGYNIKLDVYEGPLYKIRDIKWAGNYIHSDEELLQRLDYNSGDIFKEDAFNIAISERVNPLYTDKGYFYFQINPTYIPIDDDLLDIHFEIVENQIVHIRKINISGNEKTYENVIRRELRVFPGDIFSRKKLMDSYRDIFMLNFFENVIPDIIPISDDEIDIQLDVIEKNTGQANLSMGYNGMHGFTGGGGFEFPNFRGKGQTVSISYQRGMNNQQNILSTSSQTNAAYQSFSISLTEPRLFDTPNMVGASYYYTERGQGQSNPLPFDTQQQGGYISWGKRFKWPDFYFKGSWMVRFSKKTYLSDSPISIPRLTYYLGNDAQYMVDVDSSNYSYDNYGNIFYYGALPKEGIKSSGISMTQTITRDSRNHPEFPTSGSKAIWTSTLSGHIFSGNENYHKHILDFNWFVPINNKLTISQKYKVGVLKQLPSNNKYSIRTPTEYFVIGGIGIPYGEMLRGYPDPERYGDNVIGNYMMKYSLELRFSISENPTLYVLSFIEMGNAWLDADVLDPFDLKRSAGVGVRIFIPMLGKLGYDIGYGFDQWGTNEPFGWKHHLIFGMPF